MKIAFTVCSANYLPYAKPLADSVLQHNPGYKFVIALDDTYEEYNASFFSPHQVVPVPAMQLPFFNEMNSRYNMFELSCALKPYVAAYLLEANPRCTQLFYFDSDILLFDSLTGAENILKEHCLLLTPHLAEAVNEEGRIFTELNVLRTGVYNAGFFGINRSDESFAFLNWWKQRLRYHCFNDAGHGLFVDQLWLGLAPLYFKSSFVLFDPGYNLAYWNFLERKLSVQDGKYMVNQKHPLVFFHYSGYAIDQPEEISKHQKTHHFQNSPEYLPLFEEYRKSVIQNNSNDFLSLPVTLGRPAVVSATNTREKNFFKRKWKKLFKK